MFMKDDGFDSKRIDDPYITEAYIPEEYHLKISGQGLKLANRNELRHPVGVVAAKSLRYFSSNGEDFNIFRARVMSVGWLRHIYNSFNWWKAYVVNAEGERKDMPMLYIGEEFGTATGDGGNEVDIVLSAFENDRCIVDQKLKGGTIFAVGYSERGGLFNSPDMYGIKTIVGSKYKGAGVTVTQNITKNLSLMAENTLKGSRKEISLNTIHEEIQKMKIVVLDRPRHDGLVKTIKNLGAQVILVKDDDLTPTFSATRNEIDMIIGVGGIPEAVLSAMIVEELGGEMSLRLLPASVAQNEKMLEVLHNWDLFKKNEIDILRNFKLVKPGTEKEGEIPWNKIWTSKDLARGKNLVFTASIIKNNPWVRLPDGKEAPGVKLNPETGDVTVHVVRIAENKLEIVPVLYRTAIGKYLKQYKIREERQDRTAENILVRLGNAYAEFGMYQKAKECLLKSLDSKDVDKDFLRGCNLIYEYVEGLDSLTNGFMQSPEQVIAHFKKLFYLDDRSDTGLRSWRMVKRFCEYLGDKNYRRQQYEIALTYYGKALKYSPHELKLYRKINIIQMKDMTEEYFQRIDKKYLEFNYQESRDWKSKKLGTALEIFYKNEGVLNFSCREPWLIFFRRTVLHGEKPSYKLAVLIKLLRLYRKLNRANETELSAFLQKEFGIKEEEIHLILDYRKIHKKFRSVGELYFVMGLYSESLSKLLLPSVKVESQNELEDANVPLSISLVEAMEKRYKNMLEELREGYKEETQEHFYAVAEAYHYVGLALYDEGDDCGAKLYYEKAVTFFHEIVEKFEGITPVNAQYRIGNLYEELGLLYEEEQVDYYEKAVNAYMSIIDERESMRLFGNIRGLIPVRINQSREKTEYLKKEILSLITQSNIQN